MVKFSVKTLTISMSVVLEISGPDMFKFRHERSPTTIFE